jgi:hypothetical protein
MMAVFWAVAPCSLVDRTDDGGRKHLWNVGKLLQDYTAQQPKRQSSSHSPPREPEISPCCVFFAVRTKFLNIILITRFILWTVLNIKVHNSLGQKQNRYLLTVQWSHHTSLCVITHHQRSVLWWSLTFCTGVEVQARWWVHNSRASLYPRTPLVACIST